MGAALSDTTAQVLRSARSELNARFAAARHVRPALDAEAFAAFVRDLLDPLVVAVEAVRPDAAADIVLRGYDLGLELVGQGVVGARSRSGAVERAWAEAAPAAAHLVAAAPDAVLAALSNAAHRIAGTPGARPGDWVDAVAAVAPRCDDVDTLLRVGQVAAWRAGMAHLRRGALAAADALPEGMALALVGADGGDWTAVRTRLTGDPWFDPAASGPQGPRVAASAGAFRGFGGLFGEPPTVSVARSDVLVRSGDHHWLLTADAFGATFHRARPEEVATASAARRQDGVTVDGARLIVDGTTLELDDLGPLGSVAATPTTVAVTAPTTHAVVLVART